MAKTRVVHCKSDPYDVYIGRPSKYGNPFSYKEGTLGHYKAASREEAIEKFRDWFLQQPEFIAEAQRELQGKVLGCWCCPDGGCKDEKLICHGQIIAICIDSLAELSADK